MFLVQQNADGLIYLRQGFAQRERAGVHVVGPVFSEYAHCCWCHGGKCGFANFAWPTDDDLGGADALGFCDACKADAHDVPHYLTVMYGLAGLAVMNLAAIA